MNDVSLIWESYIKSKNIDNKLDTDYFNLIKHNNHSQIHKLVEDFAKSKGYIPSNKWHGSDRNFNKFQNLGGKVYVLFSVQDVKRSGFFFSDSEDIAKSFGKNTRKFYLKTHNTADLSKRGTEAEDRLINSGVSERWLNSKETWELFDEEDGEYIISKLKELGYDSVLIDEPSVENERDFSITTVVFDSNQIKLADSIIKDDTGNIIPLSQRFNINNDDIRY